jgi:hypothetical protein
MTYDIIPGPLPKSWDEIKIAWLDANLCGDSEVKPLSQTGPFSITSRPWKPNFNGTIMGGIGHVHDGGLELEIITKTGADTVKSCVSTAKYSEKPEYVFKAANMGGDKVATNHISSMTGCEKNLVKTNRMETSKNQTWSLKGNYDYSKKEGNLERGKQADVSFLFSTSAYQYTLLTLFGHLLDHGSCSHSCQARQATNATKVARAAKKSLSLVQQSCALLMA